MAQSLQHIKAETSATMKLSFQSLLSLKSFTLGSYKSKTTYVKIQLLELIKKLNEGKRHAYARIGKWGKLAPNYEIHVIGKQTYNKED